MNNPHVIDIQTPQGMLCLLTRNWDTCPVDMMRPRADVPIVENGNHSNPKLDEYLEHMLSTALKSLGIPRRLFEAEDIPKPGYPTRCPSRVRANN